MFSGLFKIIILVINLLFVGAILLADYSVKIAPETNVIPAFFGLAFPYLLLINVFFIFLWLFKLKWFFAVSLLALLASWNNIANTLAWSSKDEKEAAPGSSTVLTYNVRYFDRYNWTNEAGTSSEIFKYITDSHADIICLQEYIVDSSNARLSRFKKEMKQEGYEVYEEKIHPKGKTGIAIFTKFPIVGKGISHFEKSTNLAIYVDVKREDDTLRVYNLHLQSVHFDRSEYEMIEDIPEEDNETNWKNFLHLRSLLQKAYLKRSSQAAIIAGRCAASPYPLLLTGDFNDTPVSYTYGVLRRNLLDAFTEGGFGFSTTYIGKTLPAFRLDYILHSPVIKTMAYRVDRLKLSDHYPVSCSFVVK